MTRARVAMLCVLLMSVVAITWPWVSFVAAMVMIALYVGAAGLLIDFVRERDEERSR